MRTIEELLDLPTATRLTTEEIAAIKAELAVKPRRPHFVGDMFDSPRRNAQLADHNRRQSAYAAAFRKYVHLKKLLVFNAALADATAQPATATAATPEKDKWKLCREYLLDKLHEGEPLPVKSQDAWAAEISKHYGFSFSKDPVKTAKKYCKQLAPLFPTRHKVKMKSPATVSIDGNEALADSMTKSEPTALQNLEELELAEFTFNGMLEDHTLSKPCREKMRRWNQKQRLEAYRRIKSGEPQESVIDSL